jgi:phospholipid/cholesterol/gamma-HCH transport system ATP-binding protein
MSAAYKVADRMAMLDGGRIVFTGTPEETRQTRDPLVRQFIEGSSEGPVHAV